jgi:hypothetical protein
MNTYRCWTPSRRTRGTTATPASPLSYRFMFVGYCSLRFNEQYALTALAL